MTIRDLLRALAALDPDTDLTLCIYLKGKLLIDGRKPKNKVDTQFRSKLTDDEWSNLRLAAKTQKPAALARTFRLHRVTVSRYLSQEVKAGRMAKHMGGVIEVPGSYTKQPKPVNEVKP